LTTFRWAPAGLTRPCSFILTVSFLSAIACTPEEAAFGAGGKWSFWLYPIRPSDPAVGTRTHVAVSTDRKEKIIEFHALAHNRGATTVRAPGPRPDISPDYFGVVIRDLDGHTIEVVHWSMLTEHVGEQGKRADTRQ